MNEYDKKRIKYFLYVRKSSEDVSRQVQSIQNQIDEMKELAKRNDLEIVEIFVEEKSAKAPKVRIEFEKMIQKINKGEAEGIIAWKLDRLSRNPVDSGTLQWMLQDGTLKSIYTFQKEYKPEDNALLMSVESGMSNQFILDLRVNSLRGTRKKAKDGWLPSRAPLGYLNHGYEQGSKTIISDPDRFDLVRKMWDMVLNGASGTKTWETAVYDWGMMTPKFKKSGGVPLSKSQVFAMFSNIFYTGRFKYMDKIYQGKHEQMVTLEEFEKVQSILGRKDRERPHIYKFAFTGLMKCGCGCGNSITAERKNKVLKCNGEKVSYVYYKSTRRVKGVICNQKPIKEEVLEEQVVEILDKFEMNGPLLELAIDFIEKHSMQDQNNKNQILKTRESNILNKQEELKELKYMRRKGFIDDKEFIEDRDKIETQINILIERGENNRLIEEKAEVLKDKFRIMSSAKKQLLLKEDPEEKKKIISFFGHSHTLKDGVFTLVIEDWMIPVLTEYKKVEKEYERLELPNNFIKQGKNEQLLLACPSLGGYWESNSDSRYHKPK